MTLSRSRARTSPIFSWVLAEPCGFADNSDSCFGSPWRAAAPTDPASLTSVVALRLPSRALCLVIVGGACASDLRHAIHAARTSSAAAVTASLLVNSPQYLPREKRVLRIGLVTVINSDLLAENNSVTRQQYYQVVITVHVVLFCAVTFAGVLSISPDCVNDTRLSLMHAGYEPG